MDQGEEIREYLGSQVRDVHDKLQNDLSGLGFEENQRKKHLKEFVLNMAAEDQNFNHLMRMPYHSNLIDDEVWNLVADTRKRNSIVSTSYMVKAGNQDSGFEIR